MNLPNLIIPGAPKSATTSLHYYLNQHPDVFMCEPKEPGYFFKDELYNNEKEWYSSLFQKGENCKYRGESSTAYFKSDIAIKRIKTDLKNPKFIFILRSPVERIVSHYYWLWGRGLEKRTLKDAVLFDEHMNYEAKREIRGHYKFYLQNSTYSRWIARYIDLFDRTNIHIITTEALRSNPLDTINGCFEFLGLSKMLNISVVIKNKAEHRKMLKLDRYIIDFLFYEYHDKKVKSSLQKLIPVYMK